MISALYEDACRMEIEALKPGNVHVFADGHGMTAEQFVLSARASAEAIADSRLPVGARILGAVRATRRVVGTNTNLGIALLAAPLACAAEASGGNLQENLRAVLGRLDMEDAVATFEAIVTASPGGLGRTEEHDVHEPPTVGLIEAMGSAAAHDRIARQYVTCFDDVFTIGLTALEDAHSQGERGMWPTVLVYMAFLDGFPDSHIARKHGIAAASGIRKEAISVRRALLATSDDKARFDLLLEFDERLKARNINPGTSADLTVASLFAHKLRQHLA